MGKSIPIVCYKKLEDGSEFVFVESKSIIEARYWASTNNRDKSPVFRET